MADWSWRSEYGNVASVFGIALTIGGFVITWFNQRRLRKATEAAQQKAVQIVQTFAERRALDDLLSATALAQELRHMMRDRKWDRAADRAERLRTLLGQMVPSRRLVDEERSFLAEAVDDAHLILQAAERVMPQPDGQMPAQALRKLDALIMRLTAIDGRLRNAQLEVENG